MLLNPCKPLLPGGKAKPTLLDDEWHDVKIVRRAGDGLIEVYFDDLLVEGELLAAPTATQ